ncbi:MAG: FAD-dependent monooxygenase [Chthoniobacteraceae bacterium]|jgi:geranylgeranyl reductase family protein
MTAPPAYDIAIAGGGPAGATCATLCAEAGLRTLVLEKSRFPRDKVCGDCLNPGCWPILQRLGVAQALLDSPHVPVSSVAFVAADGRRISFPIEGEAPGEIAIPRRILDDLLLRRSRQAGVDVREETTIRSLTRDPSGHWRIDTTAALFTARRLIAADGRNSTVARLLRVAPAPRRGRVGLQAHIPSTAVRGIELHLLPRGYCGIAPVGGGLVNFCLVAKPDHIDSVKAAVCDRFAISPAQDWRAIAPLERAPVGPLRDGVLYIGDAARVVEPFTGEGIYYALQSAVLAARHIAAGTLRLYPAAHAALYRRRLWINRLARWTVTHPRAGAILLRLMSAHPASLRFLVQRVSHPAPSPA